MTSIQNSGVAGVKNDSGAEMNCWSLSHLLTLADSVLEYHYALEYVGGVVCE